MKRILLAVAFLLAMVTGSYAYQNSSYLYVYAYVVPTCNVNAPYIFFSNYSGSQMNNAGALYVTCNASAVAYEVTLDAGQHYNGAWRQVSNGTQSMIYAVYAPSGSEWGDSDHANTYVYGPGVGGSSSGGTDSIGYTAVLWGGQFVPVGWYYDTITANVFF